MKMCKICQKCGAIAEYNAYYGRVTCTKCDWVSEKISREDAKNYSFYTASKDKLKENNMKLSKKLVIIKG